MLVTGAHPPGSVWVSGPHIENLKHWSDLGANVANENSTIFNNCDMIFLGVKGDKLNAALETINTNIKDKKKKVLFISMLAGKKIAMIQQVLISNKILNTYIHQAFFKCLS